MIYDDDDKIAVSNRRVRPCAQRELATRSGQLSGGGDGSGSRGDDVGGCRGEGREETKAEWSGGERCGLTRFVCTP